MLIKEFCMNWSEQFSQELTPNGQDFSLAVGKARPLWEEFNNYLSQTYQVSPTFQYSGCSAQPGWNVKYKKKGKSLCTLYPEIDSFIVLVVIGAKEEDAVSSLVAQGLCTTYVQKLYHAARPMAIGRWLMVKVHEIQVLEDIKTLISIRMES